MLAVPFVASLEVAGSHPLQSTMPFIITEELNLAVLTIAAWVMN